MLRSKSLHASLGALAALLLPLAAGAQDTKPDFLDDSALRAAYALPASQFVEIDGEPVHFVDEGKGPPLLLLHGSFASLRQWDEWAKVLSRHYRVIRFDQSPAGLSGPNPAGDYSIEHRNRIVDGLMDRLGIERFTIVGTSSAGTPTAAYAAARPERVQAVVLANIAAGKINLDYSTLPETLKAALAADQTHPGWHGEEYWRQILLANVVDKSRVTPELVERWTQINNRMMRDPQVAKDVFAASSLERTSADLARITAPTLLLWSAQDHETTLEAHGVKAFEALAARDKTLEVVPSCGHMMPLDCPARSLERLEPFLERVTAK